MIDRQQEYLPAPHAAPHTSPNLLSAQTTSDILQIAPLGFLQVMRAGAPVIFAQRV